MKLHLPHHLLRALITSLTVLSVVGTMPQLRAANDEATETPDDIYGIYGESISTTVLNIDTFGTPISLGVDYAGTNAHGIGAGGIGGAYLTITNYGRVYGWASSKGEHSNAYGISAIDGMFYGDDAHMVLNNETSGTLTAWAYTDGVAALAQGIYSEADMSLTNRGTMSATADSSNSEARAIHAKNLSLTNDSAGTLTASAVGRTACAIGSENIADTIGITNRSGASIACTATSTTARAFGISCDTSLSLINGGTVGIDVRTDSGFTISGIRSSVVTLHNSNQIDIRTTNGNYAYGINSGTLNLNNSGIAHLSISDATYGYGIHAGTSSSITNSGTLNVSTTASYGYGMSIGGTSIITNTGMLNIESNSSSVGGYGIHASALTLTNKSGATMNVNSSLATNDVYGICASELDLTNKGAMTVHNSGGGYHSYGICAHSNTVNNDGTLDVIIKSTACIINGIGNFVSDSSNFLTLNNSNTLTVDVSTTGRSTTGPNYHLGVYGIATWGGSSVLSLTNSGKLEVSVASSVGSTPVAGIRSTGTLNLLNEEGAYLSATARTTDYGCGAVDGIRSNISTTITNRGILEAAAYAAYDRGDACGIIAYQSTLDNSGSMNVSALANRAYGIHISGLLNNSGTIHVAAASGNNTVYGIYTHIDSDTHVVNQGILNISAISKESVAYGIGLYNSNTLVNQAGASINIEALSETSTAYGIYNRSAKAYNAGELNVDRVNLNTSQSEVYLCNGSKVGAYSENGTLLVDGSGTLHLGGVLGEDAEGSPAVIGGLRNSHLDITSALRLSGVTLNLQDDVHLSLDGELTIDKKVTMNHNGHTLTIDKGKASHRVILGTAVDAEWDGAVAVEHEEGKLKLTSEGGNTMSNGTLTAKHITVESAAGTEMVLEDMKMTVSGSEMNLSNVKVQGDCSFTSTSGVLTLNVGGVTFVLDGSNSFGMGLESVAMFSADPLTQTEVSPSVFYIVSDMLEGANVAGDMTLDLSHWAEEINAGGYDSIALSLADSVNFTEGSTVQATLNGSSFAVADSMSDNILQFNVADLPSEVAPEPATTTLSLLALSMLAARRRRR